MRASAILLYIFIIILSLQSCNCLVGFLIVFVETVCMCTLFYIFQNVIVHLLACAPADTHLLGVYRKIWGRPLR